MRDDQNQIGESPAEAGSVVKAWELLHRIAETGIEVSLTYSPAETWPHEAEDRPAHRRWQAWATTVPGTDMCQYVHCAATADESVGLLYAELFPAEGGAA